MSIAVTAVKTCVQGHSFVVERCPHCASAYQRKYYTTKVKTSPEKWEARVASNSARYQKQKQDPVWVGLTRLRSRIAYERRAIEKLQDRIMRKEVALLRMVQQRDKAVQRLRAGKR